MISFRGMNLVHVLQMRTSWYLVLLIMVEWKNWEALLKQLTNAHFSKRIVGEAGELGKESAVDSF